MGVLHIRDTSTNKFVPVTSINGLTPHIGKNGNWWIGEIDTGTKAQGPAGPAGSSESGAGSVNSIAIGDVLYEPDENGMISLPDNDGVPSGGAAGQTLVKQSETDGDAQWGNVDLSNVTYTDDGVDEVGNVIGVDADTLGGKLPSEYASAEHTHAASDVGALPKDGTAENSLKLNGKSIAELMLEIYPVGSIYMSANETSPASLFGGTWEQLKDRFLLGAGDSYTAGDTGGSSAVELAQNNLPWGTIVDANAQSDGNTLGCSLTVIPAGIYYMNPYKNDTAAINTMPPYKAVYMWKRVS